MGCPANRGVSIGTLSTPSHVVGFIIWAVPELAVFTFGMCAGRWLRAAPQCWPVRSSKEVWAHLGEDLACEAFKESRSTRKLKRKARSKQLEERSGLYHTLSSSDATSLEKLPKSLRESLGWCLHSWQSKCQFRSGLKNNQTSKIGNDRQLEEWLLKGDAHTPKLQKGFLAQYSTPGRATFYTHAFPEAEVWREQEGREALVTEAVFKYRELQ